MGKWPAPGFVSTWFRVLIEGERDCRSARHLASLSRASHSAARRSAYINRSDRSDAQHKGSRRRMATSLMQDDLGYIDLEQRT